MLAEKRNSRKCSYLFHTLQYIKSHALKTLQSSLQALEVSHLSNFPLSWETASLTYVFRFIDIVTKSINYEYTISCS